MIAPIQGGYNINERIRSASFLSEFNDDILGFLFDGFFTNGLIVEEIPCDLILPIIDKTMVFKQIVFYLPYLSLKLPCFYNKFVSL